MSNYEKIKKLCKEEGITITGLEKELGFSKGSLSKIDRNKPSIERITKLADRFHKPIGYFGKEGDDTSNNSQKYYENEELVKEAQEMFDDNQMRSLFHMKKNMDPKRFQAHVDMMKEMYRLEHPEDFPEDWTD